MTSPPEPPPVVAHYARHGVLTGKILEVLERAGLARDRLSPEDLEPLDQFHNRGREATEELAAELGLTAESRVIDIGCGIGGPARWLAHRHGCQVEGIDLTESYIETARDLTALLGLRGQLRFTLADACALPAADGAFDRAVSQHAAMNIADKATLYRETARVLRPAGRFALYDVMQGPATNRPAFPLPWATLPEASHLRPAAEVKALVEGAGFTARHWADRSAEAAAAGRKRRQAFEAARREGRPPPLSPGSYLGPDFAEMLDNMLTGLEAGQLVVVQGIFERLPPSRSAGTH